MTVAEPGRRWNRSLDRLHQIARPFERLLLPAAHDRFRDLAGVAFLAVALEDRREITLVCFVHDAGRADVGRRIHAHVEWRVRGIRETSLGTVDLHRGDAEVEKDGIGLHPILRELLEHGGEVAPEKPGLDAGAPGE